MMFWLFGTSDRYECQNGMLAFIDLFETLEDAKNEAERRLFDTTKSNDYIEWAHIIKVEHNEHTEMYQWDEDKHEWQ